MKMGEPFLCICFNFRLMSGPSSQGSLLDPLQSETRSGDSDVDWDENHGKKQINAELGMAMLTRTPVTRSSFVQEQL